jgi:hypothetical protein
MLVSGRIEDILQRLDPSDQLQLELVGDPESAAKLLEEREAVARVAREPGEQPETTRLIATLRGRSTADARADLLGELVRAGVRVSSLTTRREGLEDLFLKVAGKLDGKGDAAFTPEMLRSILGESEPGGDG